MAAKLVDLGEWASKNTADATPSTKFNLLWQDHSWVSVSFVLLVHYRIITLPFFRVHTGDDPTASRSPDVANGSGFVLPILSKYIHIPVDNGIWDISADVIEKKGVTSDTGRGR
jgi:hypothetical protein